MNVVKNLIYLSIFWVIIFYPFSAPADIYRYIDKNGTVHFTNVPTDTRYRLHIRGSGFSPRPRCAVNVNVDPIIKEMADKYRVDCDLVRAVIKAESNFDPLAISSKGAKGIMQLMPGTADDMDVRNIFSPRENIEGGVKYLRRLLTMFNNDLQLTLAAYNAGENAVIGCNYRIPPYSETRDYVRRVLLYLRGYKGSGDLSIQ